MRSRIPLFVLLLIVGSFALPLAAHAGSAGGIPFFGPIIDQSWVTGNNIQCALGWGVLIEVINRIISLLLTLAIVFVAPIMIAYAGFLYVVNPVKPSERGRANKILLNTVVGIVIALAGWLIVDALMAVLYNPSTPIAGGTLGTWSSLISGDGIACLPQAGVGTGLNQTTGISTNGNAVTTAGGLSQCSSSNPNCSPAALQADGFTATQANVMSCIAVTESSGSAAPNPPCNGNACGLFQIMLSLNPLVGSACSGYAVTNCMGPSACNAVNGRALNLSSPACTACIQNERQAALDGVCNAQSAQHLVSQSGYTPWTCSNCNPSATACVQQYGQ